MKPATHKFIQVLSKGNWSILKDLADARGITVQEYIRAIVIPQYIEILHASPEKVKTFDHANRAKKGWETRRKNAEKAELQAKGIAYPGEGVLKP